MTTFSDVIPPHLVNINPHPVSSVEFESYLDHDYDLIHSNSKWKSYKANSSTNDHCYTFIDRKNNDPVWWIKGVGHVSGDIDNAGDLLDRSLTERQPEWHVLFRGGYSVWREPNGLYEICYYRYASTLFAVAPRDTCYMKLRRNLYCDDNGVVILSTGSSGNNKDTTTAGSSNDSQTHQSIIDGDQQNMHHPPPYNYCGFLLSYRSIDLPQLAPIAAGYVRTKFSGAHLIVLKDFKDPSQGFVYTYMQHAHPGGNPVT